MKVLKLREERRQLLSKAALNISVVVSANISAHFCWIYIQEWNFRVVVLWWTNSKMISDDPHLWYSALSHSLPWSVGGTCDLLLNDRMWLMVGYHLCDYVMLREIPSYQQTHFRSSLSLASPDESVGCIGRSIWQRPAGGL